MKNILKIVIGLNFILISSEIKSQALYDPNSVLQAHRRYWYYRTRFINDFTHIGNKQGDCIAFAERNHEGWPVNDLYKSKVGPDQIDQMNNYLTVLALEYKMLTRTNQSTTETIKEIFYILDTYNRLDSEADEFWGNNIPTNDSLPIDYFDKFLLVTI